MKEVKIGLNTWTSENLNTDKFRNGDSIDKITNQEQWYELIESRTPGWCYYDFDPENERYGKMYNFYAVIDERGLAPAGWRIPSNGDWNELVETIGENNATSLKDTSGWPIRWSNENGTNESGFSALPGGYLYNGYFSFKDYYAMWWSMEEITFTNKGNFMFDNEPEPLYIFSESGGDNYEVIHRGTNEEKIEINNNGYYVRCVKD